MPVEAVRCIDRHDRIRGRAAGPVRERGVPAVDGLDQANDPVFKVVFHVADVEHVLPQEPDAAGSHVVPADQELDVLERHARERERFDGGDRDVRRPAADAPHVKAERRKARREFELGGAGRTDGAVEGAAVHDEPHIGSIDSGGHERPHATHGDGELGHPAESAMAGGRECRWSRGGEQQRYKADARTAAAAQARLPCHDHEVDFDAHPRPGQRKIRGHGSRKSAGPNASMANVRDIERNLARPRRHGEA